MHCIHGIRRRKAPGTERLPYEDARRKGMDFKCVVHDMGKRLILKKPYTRSFQLALVHVPSRMLLTKHSVIG